MHISRPFFIVGSVGAVVAVIVLVWVAFFRAHGYGKDELTSGIVEFITQIKNVNLPNDSLFKQWK